MLYKDKKEIKFSKFKVIYEDEGIRKENIVSSEGKEWWNRLSEKHDNIEIVEFKDIAPTEEQVERLEKVKELVLNEHVENYVIGGVIPDEWGTQLDYIKHDSINKEKDVEIAELTLENCQLSNKIKDMENF